MITTPLQTGSDVGTDAHLNQFPGHSQHPLQLLKSPITS